MEQFDRFPSSGLQRAQDLFTFAAYGFRTRHTGLVPALLQAVVHVCPALPAGCGCRGGHRPGELHRLLAEIRRSGGDRQPRALPVPDGAQPLHRCPAPAGPGRRTDPAGRSLRRDHGRAGRGAFRRRSPALGSRREAAARPPRTPADEQAGRHELRADRPGQRAFRQHGTQPDQPSPEGAAGGDGADPGLHPVFLHPAGRMIFVRKGVVLFRFFSVLDAGKHSA